VQSNAGGPPPARHTSEPAAPRLGYMPGVDGLRALAVAAVVAYHAGATWLPGGFLGVDVFLVISGHLITSLLLAEHAATGRIALKRFWLRRARRLLPAVFVLILVVVGVMAIVHPDEVGGLRGAVASSFFYVINWFQIAVEQSYFEQFARPSVLQHLWSLAVEEQFYLVWPPVLALAFVVAKRKQILAGVAVAIVASTALAWILYAPFQDPSRIYYGTDTRAAGLLVGVALAFIRPAGVARVAREARAHVARDAVGAIALVAVLAMMLFVGEFDRALYQGGFLAIALATGLLLATVAHPASRLARVFGLPVFVWIGVRSYGIYLWHWPVIQLTRPDRDVPFAGIGLVALQVTLTIALAAASYRYVEVPFREHGFAWIRNALRGSTARARRTRVATVASAAMAATTLVVLMVAPTHTPSIPGISAAAIVPDTASAAGPATARTGGRAVAAPSNRSAGPIVAVGDSVMVGAAPALRTALGKRLVLDAAVARQLPETATVLQRLIRSRKPAVVVVHLGNNGYLPFDELEALMKSLRAVPTVVLVNVRVPKPWEASVNDALTAAARRYRNVVLADWHARTDGRADLLFDGIHTTKAGAREYATLVKQTIKKAPK
jgi:peptidoglycan/LPS O-acetylase OafA/YrhL